MTEKTLMTGLFYHRCIRWSWWIIWQYRYVDWVTCWLGVRNALFVSTALRNDRQYF
ncbi:hypothetical protein I8F73_03595 [Enterococcus faecalis]|nr:hypothetical protein [Enterococcus faecalis]